VKEPFDSAADLKDAPHVGARLRPRDAATLILVRRDGPKPRVLMGRRAKEHVFMASKWVFPGGRVEPTDARAPSASDLTAQTLGHLTRGASPSRARALGLAAIRETYEEAGLLLAQPVAPARPAPGPWRAFSDLGLAPDLSALSFIARAITPPGRTRRFDARFFLADAARLQSLEPSTGDRELDEIAWIELAKTADFDLPQITRFVMTELARRLEHPEDPPPLVRMVRGQHVIERG
jgi:8-oxo-dGTP pyrophosphatase MutT (NUDIX family)